MKLTTLISGIVAVIAIYIVGYVENNFQGTWHKELDKWICVVFIGVSFGLFISNGLLLLEKLFKSFKK